MLCSGGGVEVLLDWGGNGEVGEEEADHDEGVEDILGHVSVFDGVSLGNERGCCHVDVPVRPWRMLCSIVIFITYFQVHQIQHLQAKPHPFQVIVTDINLLLHSSNDLRRLNILLPRTRLQVSKVKGILKGIRPVSFDNLQWPGMQT